MSYEPLNVLVVREGTWGKGTQESSDQFLKTMIIPALEAAMRENAHSKEKVKIAKVLLVQNAEGAERFLEPVRPGQNDIVIFNSRAMEGTAKKFQTAHPKVRVIILTGDIPEGEIIWIDKAWLNARGRIQQMLLNLTHEPSA